MCLYLLHSFNQCWARCCFKVIWLRQNEGVSWLVGFSSGLYVRRWTEHKYIAAATFAQLACGWVWCLRSLVWTELNGPTAKEVEPPPNTASQILFVWTLEVSTWRVFNAKRPGELFPPVQRGSKYTWRTERDVASYWDGMCNLHIVTLPLAFKTFIILNNCHPDRQVDTTCTPGQDSQLSLGLSQQLNCANPTL